MAQQLSMLLVDDEVNVAHTLQLVFEDKGYVATVARSCAEALSRLQIGQYEVVITDLNLERENIGLQVARGKAVAASAYRGNLYGIRQPPQ